MTSLSNTALETITLTSGDSRVVLAPGRGGMATRFVVGDRAVFFLDEATLVDTTKNVRGGNPVLFPSPGKLEADRFARDGASGTMGQHGFARNTAWDVVAQSTTEATLRLRSNDATRAVYPWDFVATYRYALDAAALRIEQRIETTAPNPMPFGAGFHPYFHVPQAAKAGARIPTRATRAWDNAKKEEIALDAPIDLTRPEVDLHLVDHGSSTARLELPDGSVVEVRGSEHFRRWVIWTIHGKDFVCLEPWTSPGNVLNSGEGLLVAAPASPIDLWTEIALLRPTS
jgi:galactose mutarotase-like enzyme